MSSQRGFALIAALWLLVALSAAGLEVSLRAQERRLAAANVSEGARARAAALSGVEHARARLSRLLVDAEALAGPANAVHRIDPWGSPAGLLPEPVALEEARYQVHLRDAGAALNINRASEEEVFRLLLALRVDGGRAEEIAQSIMDWRDPDDLHRPRGAERDYYLRTGSPVLPRNGPFEDLSELVYVRGMTPAILERVQPYFTVLGTGQINLNAADRAVLLALPGIGEEAVAVLLRYRRSGSRIGSLAELSNELSSEGRALLSAEMARLMARTTTETREVEVRSDGWIEGGRVRAHVHALLVRSGGTAFLVWRKVR
jgi:general secretion pathway protein K